MADSGNNIVNLRDLSAELLEKQQRSNMVAQRILSGRYQAVISRRYSWRSRPARACPTTKIPVKRYCTSCRAQSRSRLAKTRLR